MAQGDSTRVLLIDPDPERALLAGRLRAQGYVVEETADAATGAHMALCAPPAAVIADLWMPSISGVQLSRLLRSEPATADVPIILRAKGDDPRDRFWCEQAGAFAYVAKGRMGDLVRALASAARRRTDTDAFFTQLSAAEVDVRDRIARQLDKALFDSVIAGEVRALGNCATRGRLFDMLSQLASRLTRYRWLALALRSGRYLAVHHHPACARAVEEARAALHAYPAESVERVVDEDAFDGPAEGAPLVHGVTFGNMELGAVAMGPLSRQPMDASLISLVARELGGPLRITMLVEESQRLAATDALTGLLNRRAFASAMQGELARCRRHGYALALALLDIDHFKLINDRHGHAAGDAVLTSVGSLLRSAARAEDLVSRWGGEEFVVAFTSTSLPGAIEAAERLRRAVEALAVNETSGEPIPVTASFGVAVLNESDDLQQLVDRADRAMYASKTSGRNRVTVAAEDGEPRLAAQSLRPN